MVIQIMKKYEKLLGHEGTTYQKLERIRPDRVSLKNQNENKIDIKATLRQLMTITITDVT